LVAGSLISFFAASEMASRSDIIFQTLELSKIGAPDIVKGFLGCLILILGAMLVVGLRPRFIALLLLILLCIGSFFWPPQSSQIHFHLEALYGVLLFFLVLVGGGQWAVSRRRMLHGQSVLDTEQSILETDNRPSILEDSSFEAGEETADEDESDYESDQEEASSRKP